MAPQILAMLIRTVLSLLIKQLFLLDWEGDKLMYYVQQSSSGVMGWEIFEIGRFNR